ncbi:cytochrome P450 [Pleomassaria siparia CBS 279.74]|uniref:Cytochrome P450 n=1 Tax=Pleomassaria siparia CBS 279.74 TaxID=1314801 RepID=A0A6G1KDD9_9PLEO|nr:cytochrome P450 [Pleomassaria siparia CBS 279.74]
MALSRVGTASSWTGKEYRQYVVIAAILAMPLAFNYLVACIIYHWTYRQSKRRGMQQVPPEYPAMIPILGSTLPFLWDSATFVKKATLYAGRVTAVRISLLVNGIYLFQDPEAVAAMWKHPSLSSPIFVYTVGLRYLFGMPEKAIESYTIDDSGPYRKPHPNSNVAPHNRVDFLTHDSLLRGLTGSAMGPTFKRYQSIVQRNLDTEGVGEEWKEMPDLFLFFRNHIGKAQLESLFGPSLLRINPGFVDDLWAYDEEVKHLAKRFPRFLIPNAYRVRDRLLAQIKNWYQYARVQFGEDAMDENGEWDPFWGSSMNRQRQAMLLNIDGQDDDSVASTDLGLIWTSITNVVPSTMMTALHIFKDEHLLSRIRGSIEDTVTHDNEAGFGVAMDKLLSKDLLQSVYAETLRLYVQSYITRCSPHEDVAVGRWWLPRNEVSMVSSYVSHMNTGVWNTQHGKHPVTSFWPERFLVDSRDDQSGPMRRDLVEAAAATTMNKTRNSKDDEPHFTLQGLSGAWIPYGGGFGACPGRLLAKRIILYTCALLVSEFDVKINTRDFEMDSSGFGLGTQKPEGQIAFAIRKRKAQ